MNLSGRTSSRVCMLKGFSRKKSFSITNIEQQTEPHYCLMATPKGLQAHSDSER